MRQHRSNSSPWLGTVATAILAATLGPTAIAQQASISAWDAAHFRIWGYIPDWDASKVNTIASEGLYSHVSDVLLFDAAETDAMGDISNALPTTTATLRQQAAQYGFKLHLSLMGNTNVTANWTSIVNTPAYRTNFVNGIKSLLQGNTSTTSDDMAGFNFDWERPSSAALWGNYTELARELGNAIHPLGMEVSVCDFGSTDFTWDDTSLFDAKVYDQIFVMVYGIGASASSTYVNQKTQLTGQGASKAFSYNQIAVGVGTYGTTTGGSATLNSLIQAVPNLPYNQGTYTGSLPQINSTTQVNGTWSFESRLQVRQKVQLALNDGLPGMFTWTLSYDSPGQMGLHRVMQHYVDFKKGIPDLDLDGKISMRDGFALADNMGATLDNTGVSTDAQFDAYYLAGNWEKGDHDGNGFVNQADADWLVNQFHSFGVTVPDRLPFTGTFDNFPSSLGINGRWKAGRNISGGLVETGNFKQEVSNYMLWSGRGAGAKYASNAFVTIRNQSSAEVAAGLNSQARSMSATLSTPIDTSQSTTTYVKFLVRENTGPLTSAELASSFRTLSLDFLNGAGVSQFDIAFHGLQHQFGVDSVADTGGQSASAAGFNSDAVYMLVAKIVGNGTGQNTMSASLFASGATVGDITSPNFSWMLTAQGSAGFNPVITDIRFTSSSVANYTVSNVWVGTASAMMGVSGSGSGAIVGSAIPEPATATMLVIAFVTGLVPRPARRKTGSHVVR